MSTDISTLYPTESLYFVCISTLDRLQNSLRDIVNNKEIKFEGSSNVVWISNYIRKNGYYSFQFRCTSKFSPNGISSHRLNPFNVEFNIQDSTVLACQNSEETFNEVLDLCKSQFEVKVDEILKQIIVNNKLRYSWTVEASYKDFKETGSYSDITYQGAKNKVLFKIKLKDQFATLNNTEFKCYACTAPKRVEICIAKGEEQLELF